MLDPLHAADEGDTTPDAMCGEEVPDDLDGDV